MPVTGAAAVRRNMGRIFKDINEKKAPQFVNLVMSIGETKSKELAPLAYADLVNSVITIVDVKSDGISATLSYNKKYAAALEFREDWKPNPPPKYANIKKGIPSAPAWNPQATPHYLRDGFESPASRAAIKRAEKIFKI